MATAVLPTPRWSVVIEPGDASAGSRLRTDAGTSSARTAAARPASSRCSLPDGSAVAAVAFLLPREARRPTCRPALSIGGSRCGDRHRLARVHALRSAGREPTRACPLRRSPVALRPLARSSPRYINGFAPYIGDRERGGGGDGAHAASSSPALVLARPSRPPASQPPGHPSGTAAAGRGPPLAWSPLHPGRWTCGDTSCLDISWPARGNMIARACGWHVTVLSPGRVTTSTGGLAASMRGRRVSGLLHPARRPRCGPYRVTLLVRDREGDHFAQERTGARRHRCMAPDSA